ncbi:MAG: hypothetical protein GY797_28590 [Deltaproteobacteria bacterium]|nr:hypothetical protein [Deltaproteobacteria bacterium]
MKNIKGIIVYTTVVFLMSFVYFLFVKNVYSVGAERETFLSEIGEGLGGIGLWLLLFIYGRTLLKVSIGKGAIAQRIIPEYYYSPALPRLKRFLIFLNRTHSYVGIAAVVVIVLHVALVGLPMDILFFPLVLALVIWQGVCGFFITWRYAPKDLKKFSYLVHAQLLTGIMIGIFAYFGHILVDN